MRSISFLSLSFVVASFALAGCAVGSSAPDDSSSSQEINGGGETVSISRDANPSIPRDTVRQPSADDRAIAKTSNLLQQENINRLNQTENIRDVVAQRKLGQLVDGTVVNVDGTIAEPGTIVDRINAAGDGRSVVHSALGNVFDHRQLAENPEALVGVGGDDKP